MQLGQSWEGRALNLGRWGHLKAGMVSWEASVGGEMRRLKEKGEMVGTTWEFLSQAVNLLTQNCTLLQRQKQGSC